MKTMNKEEKEDRAEAKRDMKMWLANDFELIEETPEFFMMRKSKATLFGHFVVFCLTWYTFGICNIIYHFLTVKKKKIIK